MRKVLRLTTQERAQLMHNIRGYDISPDMVRLSLVNLYLHGFKAPEILEYDTLTSDARWNEYYDVILANPPFMSPKGGIKPHKRFSVQSNRSEVLFVDYIAEHLTPTGRAGIIVPEGIIFQSGNAYKELRKLLVDKFLWAVVSLPAGVFNPYSGVKTSILFLDRARAEKSDSILFVKVQADGFDLGAQRRPNGKDDLPGALAIIRQGINSLPNEKENVPGLHLIVPKEKIAASGDYNLSMDRYQPSKQQHSGKWPMVKLGDVCEIKTGKKDVNQGNPNGKYPFFTCASEHTYSDGYSFDTEALLVAGNGDVGAVKYYKGKFEAYQRTYVLSNFKGVEPRYLYDCLEQRLKATVSAQKLGNTMPYIKLGMLTDFEIPLPPLEVQREIVAEIESYRRVLDGAKQVVESYKPNVEFFLRKYALGEPWEMVKLGEVIDLISGQHIDSDKYSDTPGGIPYITGPADFGPVNPVITKWTKEPKVSAKNSDILITVKGSGIGKINLVNIDEVAISRQVMAIRPTKCFDRYVYCYLQQMFEYFQNKGDGAAIPGLTRDHVLNMELPLPPREVQQAIVADIEQERALVESNRQLAQLMQAKIKAVIERVWQA
ncbi:MAG: restriction endonuclease subunit S [Spirochaetes bacterium]|nr:restriction endonuclease subunit S [Spirochaetota bacterium]